MRRSTDADRTSESADRTRPRRRAAGAVVLALLLGACGEPSAPARPEGAAKSAAATADGPAADLAITLRAAVEETPLGKAFRTEVVRTYSRDFAPDAFRPASLAPLVFVPESIDREEEPGFVRETIRGRGYVFSLDDLTDVRATFSAVPRRGGLPQTVSSEPLSLRTTPALRPDDPLDAEFPGEPTAPPRTAFLLLLVAGLGLGGAGAWRLISRGRAARAAAPASRRASARERLAKLRAAPEAPAAWEAFHVELSAALREHWEEGHALPAPRMTTEEWAASPAAAAACGARHEESVALLAACDGVKFARVAPTADEAKGRLAAAERLLAEDAR